MGCSHHCGCILIDVVGLYRYAVLAGQAGLSRRLRRVIYRRRVTGTCCYGSMSAAGVDRRFKRGRSTGSAVTVGFS